MCMYDVLCILQRKGRIGRRTTRIACTSIIILSDTITILIPLVVVRPLLCPIIVVVVRAKELHHIIHDEQLEFLLESIPVLVLQQPDLRHAVQALRQHRVLLHRLSQPGYNRYRSYN